MVTRVGGGYFTLPPISNTSVNFGFHTLTKCKIFLNKNWYKFFRDNQNIGILTNRMIIETLHN